MQHSYNNKLEQKNVIKKLQPYIVDPDYQRSHVYAVYPVQVFYDKTPPKNKEVVKIFPRKNVVDMKETTDTINKAKWYPPNSPKGIISESNYRAIVYMYDKIHV